MTEPTPEGRLWSLLRGALTTRSVAVVAELGVADSLAGGPRPVDEVARETGADADTLHRYLRALASEGVFAEEEAGVFRNTPASTLLRRDNGWNDFSRLLGGIWYRTVAEPGATAEPVFPKLYGIDVWGWLADHPAERAMFDRAMEQGKERRFERLASARWRGDETVVDVGGGNGSLLAELLRLHPGMCGIVFDLPETVRDEAALGERITFVAGSFFDVVPEGDAYVLSGILHDWNDERAAAILRTISAAAAPGTPVVLVETVVPGGNEPHGNKWLDLLLLALAGGRERDEAQWRALLAADGLEPVRLGPDLIEARCR
jgi:O-methyltransferase domain